MVPARLKESTVSRGLCRGPASAPLETLNKFAFPLYFGELIVNL